MIIEIGSKWVKDGKVVEVENIKDNHFDNNRTSRTDCVWFWDKQGSIHVLTECDFLKQYKPYGVVYEYKWAYLNKKDFFIAIDDKHFYLDEEEFYKAYRKEHIVGQRLDFTKRERKQ